MKSNSYITMPKLKIGFRKNGLMYRLEEISINKNGWKVGKTLDSFDGRINICRIVLMETVNLIGRFFYRIQPRKGRIEGCYPKKVKFSHFLPQ